MPPLAGFSDNAFRSHADFKTASITLLRALKPYQSPDGARIRLPLVTGTHFDDVAAQLEGYARALWAVGTLLHSSLVTKDEYNELIEPYVKGLANGTDPKHAEYWLPVVLRDQRMVEMEIISFALLAAPDAMFLSQSERAKQNITEWLKTINGKDFPQTNWLWFRVMTNLALVKVCGVAHDEVVDAMKADLDTMEQFYLSDGWAADGFWSEDGRQADYYSGSFAIQFSQLIYAKMARDIDPERCDRFIGRAKEFAVSFWRYFDTNGAAIPFGRSLTYRFAFAGFWSAIAFADVKLPSPLDDWGAVKGLLLRHFRWWSTKHDMFNVDGTLTIGFTYPNMYMGEDYNSPQSPYWALKSFLALGIPDNHPFWTAQEKKLPTSNTLSVVPNGPPMHIICNNGNHHFLLSMGQYCPWPLKATEAKYGKYAYSSHFGFSVPTGTLIQQIAPDNTLALSKDGGDTWRVPWKVSEHNFGTATVRSNEDVKEIVTTLRSKWKPWRDADIEVTTTLIPPTKRWPDWHIRVHEISNRGFSETPIQSVQGGFAIHGRGAALGEVLLAKQDVASLVARDAESFVEGILHTSDGALVCSSAGASGIRATDLIRPHDTGLRSLNETQRAEILKPDANTNLMWQRTLIPTITSSFVSQKSDFLASAVFALARTSDREQCYSSLDIGELWEDVPVLSVTAGSVDHPDWYISLE
ncbi:hypothetical protein HBH56_029230 [Parastagonospora nodorum]|uniref:DUF2264 domain-containing protein n=2 Tax=Phaeosphaeria nodorum (strain SN15 / ATCC MYA-4574 / FGSC 10173) TaxID=321614 RepID=A0A7U2I4K1_PHANO|nr:hypothetical protein SNOG_06510 [Parastagonospora nodorum SN15]KAH3919131.1 hypothetical protein HBH56_029230 [Parastagonospora nodorum]EAT86341.1 hypothetical protein SNOG_06510 [Parastagonospora nodorum SN15]KAH3934501.1 hypothetical protein HBH54_052800 [Parastagonospora nodorum]KAH3984925.1 hypothetical protein HBH52_051630 [Parastagonospora nodorum]KAH4038976.1 hypothetical protein HBI09_042210 [Parastagonospora nodorum]